LRATCDLADVADRAASVPIFDIADHGSPAVFGERSGPLGPREGATLHVPAEAIDMPLPLFETIGERGRFQCTMACHHRWKSSPSCPTDVVARTNGGTAN
jgi:hypothetical protein